MKLLKSLTQLIIESKVDDIYNKYYKDIPRNIFDRIVKADPKTRTQNDNVILIGKYAKVLLNIYKIGNMPNLENLVEATRYLKIVYDKNLSIDLKSIKQISDLYDVVKRYIVSIETPIKEILKELPKDSYKILHNGEEWVVFRPLTEKAAAWLGVGSSWCTTWGKYSLDPAYKTRGNLFTTYNYAPIYIMIDKSDEKHKYQFQFKKNEFRDVRDGMIGIKTFFDKYEELRNFYFPLLEGKEGIFDEDTQFERMDTLPGKFSTKLQNIKIERLIADGIDNPIALAFAQNYTYSQMTEYDEDDDESTAFISDNNVDDFTYDGPNIDFDMRNPCSKMGSKYYSIDTLTNHISYLEREKRNNSLGDIIYDGERYDFHETLENYVNQYFDKNSQSIKFIEYGFPTLDKFKEYFLTIITHKNSRRFDKLFEVYSDKMYDATISNFNGAIERDLDYIKEYAYISESGYYSYSSRQTQTLSVNAYHFIKYLNFQRIDEIDNFCQLFENYIDYADIVSDDFHIDYDTAYPSYDDMKPIIEEVLEEFITDEYGSVDNPNTESLEVRKKLIDLIGKHYEQNNDYKWQYRDYSYVFDGSLVKIYLNPVIDFDTLTVPIVLIDKKSNNEYRGNMPVDELYNNMFNYKLDLFLNNSDVEES
jgi:hypothetical protein